MNDIETRRKKLPVLLFIRGEQYFDDVDPDATELTTEGTLELTEKGLLLTYQETALTGMEGLHLWHLEESFLMILSMMQKKKNIYMSHFRRYLKISTTTKRKFVG